MADPRAVVGWIYVIDEGIMGKSWKKRWGVLQPTRLEYAKGPEESGAQNFFPLDHDSKVTRDITLEAPKKSDILPLQLRTPCGPALVGFAGEAERQQWFTEISARIAKLVDAEKQMRDDGDVEATYAPPKTQQHEFLDLEVIEADGLPKMDTIGSCDAYCRIHCAPYRKIRTSTVPNKLNPLWKEDFTFILQAPDIIVRIDVWDSDSTGDDEFVGQVYIPIKNFTPGAIVDQWFDLKPRSSKDPANPGKIHLRLQRVRPSAPQEGFLSAYGIPSLVIPRRVDTGDLLLFNNQTVLSAGLRAITRSKYDHVAMVVRKWDNALVILESTIDGVAVYKYDSRFEMRTRYAVAIRRLLRVERTAEMRKTVWDFVNSVRGKPYEAQTLQMLNSAFKLNSKEDLSTIFCSELVAAVYHKLEILDRAANSSNNYLPADFAPEGSAYLPFLLGATLEPKVIVFLALKKKDKKGPKLPAEQRTSATTLTRVPAAATKH